MSGASGGREKKRLAAPTRSSVHDRNLRLERALPQSALTQTRANPQAPICRTRLHAPQVLWRPFICFGRPEGRPGNESYFHDSPINFIYPAGKKKGNKLNVLLLRKTSRRKKLARLLMTAIDKEV